MSEKCLYCQTPIEQKEGKRERKFCTPSHCTMYHLKEKNKDKPKGQRGRPAGAKNKPQIQYVLPQPIPEVIICHDSVTTTKDMSVVEIRKKFGDEYGDKGEQLLAVYHSGKEPTEDVIALANEMAKLYDCPVMKETIDELINFGTVTTKTEIVNDKVKTKVIDKKKIVNEDAEWKPKLSPFMLSRQKTKGGGQ